MIRRSARILSSLLAVSASLTAVGCCQPPKTAVSLERLVTEYNANAAAVPRLWARAKIQVTLVEANGLAWTWGSTSPLAVPSSLLLLGKGADKLGPHDFVLVGREAMAVELFRLGSSAGEGAYYFWYRFGRHGGAWWGRHKFAGAPGVECLPIDPSQLLAVLGVSALPEDFTQLPTVLLRMDTTPCQYAYVLSYVDRRPVSRHIGCRREVYFVWDDDKPRRPFRVKFFDAAGRGVLTAKLKDYRPIDVADLDDKPPTAPVMPTDIEITWTGQTQRPHVSRIHLVLSEMTTADIWQRQACRFRENLPPGIGPDKIVQVDEGLEKGGGRK